MSKIAPVPKPIYDRREQRAIGHFIDLVHDLAIKKGISYFEAIKKLQEEHGCYD